MSGGNGGKGAGGAMSRSSRRYGVDVNMSSIGSRLAENPARSSESAGLGGAGAGDRGKPDPTGGAGRTAVPRPPTETPAGGDTGSVGSDNLANMIRQAPRSRGKRMARGGGLSNVSLGGVTLG